LKAVGSDAGDVTHDLPAKAAELPQKAASLAADLPQKAASLAGSAGDVAHDLGERAKSLVPSKDSSGNGTRQGVSLPDLAKRRDERARARAERRKAR
jgi:hypothetical protein